jgi:putative N6-adenine-specific DNA methylase
MREVSWDDLIPRGRPVVISKVRSKGSKLSAETSIQAVAHKAVAECLCEAWRVNRLPETDNPSDKPAEIRIYLDKDQASIALDLSGEPLFRRGYRTEGGNAPLRETSAAALLLLMGWKRKYPLYDPFCGSGTIAVEAALYAWDAAPGLGRSFALSQLAFGDRAVEAQVREELADKVDFSRIIRISGSDIDGRAAKLAAANMERAYDLVQRSRSAAARSDKSNTIPNRETAKGFASCFPAFHRLDMAQARAAEGEDRGFILCNPPYGERLGDLAKAEENYRAMGHLVQDFPGWTMGFITNHEGFESHFGKTATAVREITNGALRSYLYFYEGVEERQDVDSSRA